MVIFLKSVFCIMTQLWNVIHRSISYSWQLHPIVIFIISPTILLIVYPTRLFRKCVSSCGFRSWHALHMIVESFQGQYKDGTNGTRNFRMASASFLILRILTLVSFYKTSSLWGSSDVQGLLLLCTTCIYAVVRPYKHNFRNIADILPV